MMLDIAMRIGIGWHYATADGTDISEGNPELVVAHLLMGGEPVVTD